MVRLASMFVLRVQKGSDDVSYIKICVLKSRFRIYRVAGTNLKFSKKTFFYTKSQYKSVIETKSIIFVISIPRTHHNHRTSKNITHLVVFTVLQKFFMLLHSDQCQLANSIIYVRIRAISCDSAHYNDFAYTYKIVDANRHLPIASTITCSITMLARATIVAVLFLAPHRCRRY